MDDLKHLSSEIAGPVALGLFAILYNKYALGRQRPTISTSVRRLSNTRLGVVLICGIIGALLGHWFIDQTGK